MVGEVSGEDTEEPFDEDALERSLAGTPDWMNLGPAYVDALAYAHACPVHGGVGVLHRNLRQMPQQLSE